MKDGEIICSLENVAEDYDGKVIKAIPMVRHNNGGFKEKHAGPGKTIVKREARDAKYTLGKYDVDVPEPKNQKLIEFKFNDGGREESGRKGFAGDCVCRAIVIASGRPYEEVYNRLAEGNATQRITKRTSKSNRGKRTARNGICVKRKWFKDYMKEIGFEWHATMKIGQGCKTHLRADELPKGRLVVQVSKHFTSVIDGVLNDTWDCSRDGTRCVYGYYKLKE